MKTTIQQNAAALSGMFKTAVDPLAPSVPQVPQLEIPEIKIDPANFEMASPTRTGFDMPSMETLMTPVPKRPAAPQFTPRNTNRFRSQGTFNQQWGQNVANQGMDQTMANWRKLPANRVAPVDRPMHAAQPGFRTPPTSGLAKRGSHRHFGQMLADLLFEKEAVGEPPDFDRQARITMAIRKGRKKKQGSKVEAMPKAASVNSGQVQSTVPEKMPKPKKDSSLSGGINRAGEQTGKNPSQPGGKTPSLKPLPPHNSDFSKTAATPQELAKLKEQLGRAGGVRGLEQSPQRKSTPNIFQRAIGGVGDAANAYGQQFGEMYTKPTVRGAKRVGQAASDAAGAVGDAGRAYGREFDRMYTQPVKKIPGAVGDAATSAGRAVGDAGKAYGREFGRMYVDPVKKAPGAIADAASSAAGAVGDAGTAYGQQFKSMYTDPVVSGAKSVGRGAKSLYDYTVGTEGATPEAEALAKLKELSTPELLQLGLAEAKPLTQGGGYETPFGVRDATGVPKDLNRPVATGGPPAARPAEAVRTTAGAPTPKGGPGETPVPERPATPPAAMPGKRREMPTAGPDVGASPAKPLARTTRPADIKAPQIATAEPAKQEPGSIEKAVTYLKDLARRGGEGLSDIGGQISDTAGKARDAVTGALSTQPGQSLGESWNQLTQGNLGGAWGALPNAGKWGLGLGGGALGLYALYNLLRGRDDEEEDRKKVVYASDRSFQKTAFAALTTLN